MAIIYNNGSGIQDFEITDIFKYSLYLNLFKVNNINPITRCKTCLKFLTIKIRQKHQWHSSGVFIVKFEQVIVYGVILGSQTLTPPYYAQFCQRL